MGALIYTTSRIDSSGKVYPLGLKSDAGTRVTAEEIKDPERLSRILTDIANDLSMILSKWSPRRVDFEGVVCGTAGAATQLLQHNFNGAVRWWVVGWTGATAGVSLVELTSGTTSTTIRFQSYAAGTAVIRVEEAG